MLAKLRETLAKLLLPLLIVLLLALQYQLWLGAANKFALAANAEKNQLIKHKNQQLSRQLSQLKAEIADLDDGKEVLEENARMHLGMIKQDEVYVQFLPQ